MNQGAGAYCSSEDKAKWCPHAAIQVGRFDKSIPLDTATFRESWKWLEEKLKDTDREKRIMTYCTGGIRCVKVGAFLEQELGFKNVVSVWLLCDVANLCSSSRCGISTRLHGDPNSCCVLPIGCGHRRFNAGKKGCLLSFETHHST